MKVSEIARAASVNPETVRYYTREGLLNPSRNPENGYHQYSDDDLQRLKFARKARQLGFALSEIQSILGEADHHHSPCPMVRDIFARRLQDVEERLAELEALRNRMREAMTAWETMPDGNPDGHTICRLIEKWDEASETNCCDDTALAKTGGRA
ncbi:Zn(2+)-responsive transcriptional regulator [Marinobacter nanhaiticus D15-8W]|uniref:MerR family transcriptional regulator n=1 Tax=Marinobacter nanhaiticus D15-8W TaxID=626887 RepID=N6W5B7_9GAMM|nr:MerR family transcriptional regulator [Marinobacter nanhaiticus]ENO15409.1 MerR family transcriptional regulator [Marinobacter nanhaiticus D15-8W]BES73742.1 Zn(2+)-responsive transcriptional regulator [Marinobacter nanhaiticus D15-8W]